MLSRFAQIALLVGVLTFFSACSQPSASPMEGTAPMVADPASSPLTAEPLMEEIAPCTPVPGSSVDPCDAHTPPIEIGIAQSVPYLGDEPSGVRHMLEDGLSPPAWVAHIALRGTYLPDTVRCTDSDPFRPPSYLSNEFDYEDNPSSIKCYIDVRANSYILGSGPTTLTLLLFAYIYWHDQYSPYLEEGQTAQDLVEENRQQIEADIEAAFPGREHMIFLGPPPDLSSEAWRLLGYWDVQRQEDGTVLAVHPYRDLWQSRRPDDYATYRSQLEMGLPAFTQAVTTAHQARVTEYDGRIGEDEDLPDLVTNANDLRDYYVEVGAYDEGEPAPAQPPPPCGLAVPDQANNPGLMRDCVTLLALKDTLRGTAALNWSVDTTIGRWDGVTVEDMRMPDRSLVKRVTVLDLSSRSLTGTIPAGLGELDALLDLRFANNRLTGEIPAEVGSLADLETLWLFRNQLTGDIPPELGDLANLVELYLANNSFTGCIPASLRDVAANDLDRLGLPDCADDGG